jgi:cytochrome c oxidase assembly factor CtaG
MRFPSPQIAWTFEPSVIVVLATLSVAYGWAWTRARRPGAPHPPGYGRLALFAGAVACVVLALLSPVDVLGEQLMVMHMVQHVLILDIAPILFILSLSKGLLRPVTRRLTRVEERAGVIAHPVFAVLLYIGVMAAWHVPGMYDLALRHEGIHVFEHVCFVVAGSLYWWHLLSPIRSRMRLDGMGPVMYMVTTKLGVGMIGVILTFAPASFYPWYEHHPHYWGLSPRVDMNLAGALMALEQSVVMGAALVWLFMRMLTESERKQQQAERYELASS